MPPAEDLWNAFVSDQTLGMSMDEFISLYKSQDQNASFDKINEAFL
jgi:hypothetical protein